MNIFCRISTRTPILDFLQQEFAFLTLLQKIRFLVPNCPLLNYSTKLSMVPNCHRCQIVHGVKLSTLPMVPNCTGCKIIRGANLSVVPNCPLLPVVPNCPRTVQGIFLCESVSKKCRRSCVGGVCAIPLMAPFGRLGQNRAQGNPISYRPPIPDHCDC